MDAPLVEVSELRRYCGLDWVQLHGDESEDQAADAWAAGSSRLYGCLRSAHPTPVAYPGRGLLLDTYHPQAVGRHGQEL